MVQLLSTPFFLIHLIPSRDVGSRDRNEQVLFVFKEKKFCSSLYISWNFCGKKSVSL